MLRLLCENAHTRLEPHRKTETKEIASDFPNKLTQNLRSGIQSTIMRFVQFTRAWESEGQARAADLTAVLGNVIDELITAESRAFVCAVQLSDL
jgi:hypothetical protein